MPGQIVDVGNFTWTIKFTHKVSFCKNSPLSRAQISQSFDKITLKGRYHISNHKKVHSFLITISVKLGCE